MIEISARSPAARVPYDLIQQGSGGRQENISLAIRRITAVENRAVRGPWQQRYSMVPMGNTEIKHMLRLAACRTPVRNELIDGPYLVITF